MSFPVHLLTVACLNVLQPYAVDNWGLFIKWFILVDLNLPYLYFHFRIRITMANKSLPFAIDWGDSSKVSIEMLLASFLLLQLLTCPGNEEVLRNWGYPQQILDTLTTFRTSLVTARGKEHYAQIDLAHEKKWTYTIPLHLSECN